VSIKAFTLSTCAYCWQFKRFMERHGVAFEYVDVDLLEGEERNVVDREADRYCPGCGYPIIVANGTVIRGFDEPRLREVLGL
jgi:glutaredoxin